MSVYLDIVNCLKGAELPFGKRMKAIYNAKEVEPFLLDETECQQWFSVLKFCQAYQLVSKRTLDAFLSAPFYTIEQETAGIALLTEANNQLGTLISGIKADILETMKGHDVFIDTDLQEYLVSFSFNLFFSYVDNCVSLKLEREGWVSCIVIDELEFNEETSRFKLSLCYLLHHLCYYSDAVSPFDIPHCSYQASSCHDVFKELKTLKSDIRCLSEDELTRFCMTKDALAIIFDNDAFCHFDEPEEVVQEFIQYLYLTDYLDMSDRVWRMQNSVSIQRVTAYLRKTAKDDPMLSALLDFVESVHHQSAAPLREIITADNHRYLGATRLIAFDSLDGEISGIHEEIASSGENDGGTFDWSNDNVIASIKQHMTMEMSLIALCSYINNREIKDLSEQASE